MTTPVIDPSAPRPLELRLDPEQRAFRDEVRTFLAGEMRDATAHADPLDLTGCTLEFERAHQRRCGERGYLGISVPAVKSRLHRAREHVRVTMLAAGAYAQR